MKLARPVLLVGAFALAALACGGGGTTATTQPPAATTVQSSPSGSPAGGTAMLALKDNVFDPVDLTIAAGSQVTVKNEGASLHNFSVEGQGVDQDVQSGTSQTIDLSSLPAGTYTMFCKYHRALGMEGTLTVSG